MTPLLALLLGLPPEVPSGQLQAVSIAGAVVEPGRTVAEAAAAEPTAAAIPAPKQELFLPAMGGGSGYGAPQHPVSQCLKSGARVSATNRGAWCIDVTGSVADGAKLVVDVTNHRPVDVVRLGEASYVRGYYNGSVGAIIEVKRYQQTCEVCNTCACIGCGQQCECSCNALCRLDGGSHC